MTDATTRYEQAMAFLQRAQPPKPMGQSVGPKLPEPPPIDPRVAAACAQAAASLAVADRLAELTDAVLRARQ